MKVAFTITLETSGKQYADEFENHIRKMCSEAQDRWGFEMEYERTEVDE